MLRVWADIMMSVSAVCSKCCCVFRVECGSAQQWWAGGQVLGFAAPQHAAAELLAVPAVLVRCWVWGGGIPRLPFPSACSGMCLALQLQQPPGSGPSGPGWHHWIGIVVARSVAACTIMAAEARVAAGCATRQLQLSDCVLPDVQK